MPTAAFAQDTTEAATPTGAETPLSGADETDDKSQGTAITVTGSRIKQDPNDSALPLQVITTQEIQRNGISSPEQLIMYLSSNGNGADNLASNGDVTSGAQRGTNGLSAANLRGQGSAATLVLLNGRRVAAHGLTGGAVDVNQIPFAAIERIEVLKDGASAIYGTDAVGGVINFITRKDYQGIGAQGMVDVTQEGDGNIYRVSGIAGYGDLDKQGFNVMGAVAYSWNQILRGADRDFVNGNQPNRGLSVDTRGTPIATAFNIGANTQPGSITAGGTLLTGLTLTAPNGANAASGGINTLDLPGGAGCGSMDGGMPYDETLWNTPSAIYACSWDTGRAAVIQQPIQTLTYYGRGVVRVAGSHELSLEVTGSDAKSAKSFSNAQLTANTTNLPVAYPLNASTATQYNTIFNAIRAAFPNAAQQAALDARYGQPISYRWRCDACGPREYTTDTKTLRVALAAEGPLWSGWDYRAGASYARSESSSLLGTGYYYRGTTATGAYDPLAPAAAGAGTINGQVARGLVGVMNSGLINPFSITQSDAGLAALQSVSAAGTTLYGGKYEVRQFDGSVSGGLFHIWGGDVKVAAGFDYRRETYAFNGSAAAAATAPVIFLAAFDNVNALTPKTRDVKAAYAEILVPLLPGLEITGAGRVDNYTGFGSTFNPKVSVKFRPWEPLMFRGSYNTAFRVPSFNQIFNGVTESPYAGSDIADPTKCPGGVPTSNFGSGQPCAQIRPNIDTGGNLNLGPETAKEFSLGVVVQPDRHFSASVDWWVINVDNTIQSLTLRQLIDNAALFPQNFIRDGTGSVVTIDDRWINAGARRTQGLEVAAHGDIDALGGQFAAGIDGTYLLKKREKLTPTSAYGPSLVGVFTYAGDLGIKWKHSAFISYSTKDVTLSLSQIFRSGYKNNALPGIAAGTVTRADYNSMVNDYVVYNLSMSYTGLAPGIRLTAGVKNLFNTDPPFAVTYDGNTGAGSSWEPRVADPRGRSFIVSVDTKF
ncbi:MAG: TonB-dependent receptor [Sphingomonas sp.]